ncbi:hypothetical protein D3OALGB2SA_1811 [Olavius algarvensis associated proteobacterium Delta 3]|nr:hypothetical protein D3OALGB2SA_1811 [Olavius algarvensis associated proteobacterium Delta 3]
MNSSTPPSGSLPPGEGEHIVLPLDGRLGNPADAISLELIPEETRQEMLERGNYWKKTFESQEREANEVQPVSEEQ